MSVGDDSRNQAIERSDPRDKVATLNADVQELKQINANIITQLTAMNAKLNHS